MDHTAASLPQNPEVPASDPSILSQCQSFTNAADQVDLVMIAGGINDVGVTTIIDPFGKALSPLIADACFSDMLTFLNQVSAKFTKPSCKILVLGYYPNLSDLSDPDGTEHLLRAFGRSAPTFIADRFDFLQPIIARCEQFFTESTAQLQLAIAHSGDSRIKFVSSGFTDANSIFVPDTSLLWGLNMADWVSPEDPMAGPRHALCDAVYPGIGNLGPRETCYRASVGHPNVAGAIKYSDQIVAALS